MTQQIGPYGVFNPGAQTIGGGVSNPAAGPALVTLSSWPMNEGTGLTLNDTSGNVNTATLSGVGAAPWFANAGLPGLTPAWQATGNALATSTTVTNFDGTTPFSIGAWVIPYNTTTGSFLGTLDAAGGSDRGWDLVWNGSPATIAFILANAIPANWLAISGSILLSSGVGQPPSYIVVTYDGSKAAAGVKMYVNGVLDTGTSIVSNNLTGSSANGLPVRFGARNDGSSEYLGGMAFDQIVNGVWSGTKIAANFALGPQIYTP